MLRLCCAALLAVLTGCAANQPVANQADLAPTCISDGMEVGSRLKHLETGRVGVVERIYGPALSCAVAGHSRLADVRYER